MNIYDHVTMILLLACLPYPMMGTRINKWVDVPLMWNAAFCSGPYFYATLKKFFKTFHLKWKGKNHLGQVLLTKGGGTEAVCPGPWGPQTVLNSFKCTSQSNFSKGFISLYCSFQVSLFFFFCYCAYAAWTQTSMHTLSYKTTVQFAS